MIDASEVGVEWVGTLHSLSSILSAPCASLAADGQMIQTSGTPRCHLDIEHEIVLGSFGKLVWGKRDKKYDVILKRAEKHPREEAIIQWLAHRTLNSVGLGEHTPKVLDIFTRGGRTWFSMIPIYDAPIFDDYLPTLKFWKLPHPSNGIAILKVLAQIAMACHVLEQKIGFNHRDLKPDNILVKVNAVHVHTLTYADGKIISLSPAPTAILIDYGFACLGPGTMPWLHAGNDALSQMDMCPRVGRDIFMLLVFLLWRKDVRDSLTPAHLAFFKTSLSVTETRWKELLKSTADPTTWIYTMITDNGFHCPALNPWTWLTHVLTTFPEVGSIRTQSSS